MMGNPIPSPRFSIVVFDVEADLRALLQDVLTIEGHIVVACATRAELDHAITQVQPDLLVLDTWGSSMLVLEEDERDALRNLGRRMPTILTTGCAWAQQRDPADLGVAAILLKPYAIDELILTVERLLRRA